MQLNDLKTASSNTKARRVGRGGKRGKTSGKGHKGQKSRAGHKIRPAMRDIIKKIPKRRGYGKNRARTVHSGRIKPAGVNLATLEGSFESGTRVTPRALVAKGIVRNIRGKAPKVKILGMGKLTKQLTIADCQTSETAKDAIVKAGGQVL